MTVRAIAHSRHLVCTTPLRLGRHGRRERLPLSSPWRPPMAPQVIATDVRIGGDDKQTRFVVDLNRKIDLAALRSPIRTAW